MTNAVPGVPCRTFCYDTPEGWKDGCQKLTEVGETWFRLLLERKQQVFSQSLAGSKTRGRLTFKASAPVGQEAAVLVGDSLLAVPQTENSSSSLELYRDDGALVACLGCWISFYACF